MANTATWVDERYSQLLSTQHGRAIADILYGKHKTKLRTIEGMRASLAFMQEHPVIYGYGVKKKHGTMCYHAVCRPGTKWIALVGVLYDSKGKLSPQGKGHTTFLGYIKGHAHDRLFERLRTNDSGDVMAALKIVSEYLIALGPPSYEAEEIHIKVPGGALRGDTMFASKQQLPQLVWLLRTFVRDKP